MDKKLHKYILSLSLPPESLVGEIKILSVIGAGRNGIVYQALDTVSRNIVALKEYIPINLVNRDSSQSVVPIKTEENIEFQNGKKQFLEKGLKISQLNHPNIVRMTRVIEENNTVYLVMDKVDGEPLSNKIGPSSFIPPDIKKSWINKILSAIECIHKNGTLHLAIEPSNILIDEKNEPILIDFGQPEDESDSNNSNIKSYTAIEVVNGNLGQVGKWTDIYATGCVFYHLLSDDVPVPATARYNSKNDPQPKLGSIQALKAIFSTTLLNSIDTAIAIKPEHRFDNIEDWQLAFSDKQESKIKTKGRLQLGLIVSCVALASLWVFYGKNYYAEHVFWQTIDQNSDPCSAREYLESYPDGRFGQQANVKVELCEEREAIEEINAREERQALTNKLTGELIRIEAGCFYMGSDINEPNRSSDERLHEVCINNAFEMGVSEVTVGQFSAFVQQTNYKTDAEKNIENEGCWALEPQALEDQWAYHSWASWRSPFKDTQIDDTHPVVCVSPNDVKHFINWLNEVSQEEYRLPTEAEWEFTTRGRGVQSTRPWGDNETSTCEYANVADTSDGSSNSSNSVSPWPNYHSCFDGYLYTSPINSFRPNFYGIYDLIGNVWEMTCSAYSGSYGGMENECISLDESEPTLTDKGGSWESGPHATRSATRGQIPFFDRGSNIGFRLARNLGN